MQLSFVNVVAGCPFSNRLSNAHWRGYENQRNKKQRKTKEHNEADKSKTIYIEREKHSKIRAKKTSIKKKKLDITNDLGRRKCNTRQD